MAVNRRISSSFVMALVLLVMPNVIPGSSRISATAAAPAAQPRVSLIAAPTMTLPGGVDSNSPIVWDLEDGQRRMFAFTSHSGVPSMASGSEVGQLGTASEILIQPHPGHGVWME